MAVWFGSVGVLNRYHHGGRVPPGAVDIMRGTRWGNPFVIGRDGDRAEVVRKYRRWLWQAIQSDPGMADAVRQLHGRDLCCCCAPAACHGDVLLAAAAWLSRPAVAECPAMTTPCACLGPRNGEPHCDCVMVRMGLPRSPGHDAEVAAFAQGIQILMGPAAPPTTPHPIPPSPAIP